MKLYIDSDSILYRSAHINNHKDDCADEAMALEVDYNIGIYVSRQGDGEVEFRVITTIAASSEQEALAIYSSRDNPMPMATAVLEAEDLGLEDAEATDILEAMQSTFHSMVNAIVQEVQLEYPDIDPTPVLVLTVKNSSTKCSDLDDNFRYEVMESVEDPAVKAYKHSRAGMEVPDGLLAIYDYVFDLPNTICIGGVEADDVVVYYGLQGHIVAALDKDVLKSLPKAYNFGKCEWVEYTETERRLWFFTQIVTGDSSDGLRGAYRVGEVWCKKNLLPTDTELQLWTKAVTAYFTKEQSLDEAIATARCVSMTQWTPERGLVYWQPPKKEKK